MPDDPDNWRTREFWDRPVGYGTRRGCLIVVISALVLVAVIVYFAYALRGLG